jgi:hypothetical protein
MTIPILTGLAGFFRIYRIGILFAIRLTQESQGAQKERKRRSEQAVLAQRRGDAEELSMCDAAGRKRISSVWKFKISYGSDSDLDPFLAKNAKSAKSAKELGRFSRGFHLRPSATSAVENPELPRHGKCHFKSAQ